MRTAGNRSGQREKPTLIEVMVVLAILSILASICFPVFAKVQEKRQAEPLWQELHAQKRQVAEGLPNTSLGVYTLTVQPYQHAYTDTIDGYLVVVSRDGVVYGFGSSYGGGDFSRATVKALSMLFRWYAAEKRLDQLRPDLGLPPL